LNPIEEATMSEVEGARYDRDKSAADLNLLLELDEPVLLMTELKEIAEHLAKRGRADGWRFIAKWAAEGEAEFAKQQEPKPAA
jgi:hypothetical protein